MTLTLTVTRALFSRLRASKRCRHLSGSGFRCGPEEADPVPDAPIPQIAIPSTAKATFVKSPKLDIISNIIFTGKANMPFKNTDVSLDDFNTGAVQAIDVVTKQLAQVGDDFSSLEDLVTKNLMHNFVELNNLPSQERANVGILPEDIFFSWVSEAAVSRTTGIFTIRYVVMSMPGIGEAKRQLEENTSRRKAFVEELQSQKVGTMEAKTKYEEFQTTMHNPVKALQNKNNFTVANFVFVQPPKGDWLLDEIVMMRAKEIFHPLFFFRWKGRIGIMLRGFTFLGALRYDYGTDLMVLSCFTAFVLNSIFS